MAGANSLVPEAAVGILQCYVSDALDAWKSAVWVDPSLYVRSQSVLVPTIAASMELLGLNFAFSHSTWGQPGPRPPVPKEKIGPVSVLERNAVNELDVNDPSRASKLILQVMVLFGVLKT